nr:MAG TPA: hypothetical protein [Caudoviricetes sp.]
MRYRRGRPKAFLARQVPTIGRGQDRFQNE